MDRRQLLWAAAAAALVLAVGSAAADGGFRRYFRLSADVRQLREKTAALREENARLKAEIAALRDDDAALERAAREELGFVRPGELVLVLEEP